jgi:hypothetical protein
VTINCAERGLLLLRVRDEMRMNIAAYQVGRKPPVSWRSCSGLRLVQLWRPFAPRCIGAS